MHQTGQEKNTEPLFKSLGYVKYLNVFKRILLCLQLFSVTWSFRNHSNILICCLKHFLLVSIFKTVMLLNIFVETVIHFFSGFFDK